jgi:predicted nucleotidyltransferase component of viral defense system
MNAVPGKAVIEEVALELGIDPAFVEKDWYVVQLIREITNPELLGAQVIFTGGTSLSNSPSFNPTVLLSKVNRYQKQPFFKAYKYLQIPLYL